MHVLPKFLERVNRFENPASFRTAEEDKEQTRINALAPRFGNSIEELIAYAKNHQKNWAPQELADFNELTQTLESKVAERN